MKARAQEVLVCELHRSDETKGQWCKDTMEQAAKSENDRVLSFVWCYLYLRGLVHFLHLLIAQMPLSIIVHSLFTFILLTISSLNTTKNKMYTTPLMEIIYYFVCNQRSFLRPWQMMKFMCVTNKVEMQQMGIVQTHAKRKQMACASEIFELWDHLNHNHTPPCYFYETDTFYLIISVHRIVKKNNIKFLPSFHGIVIPSPSPSHGSFEGCICVQAWMIYSIN